ncbi:MAG: hypothetical protein WBC71_14900, partial [Salaquimonas sp.]
SIEQDSTQPEEIVPDQEETSENDIAEKARVEELEAVSTLARKEKTPDAAVTSEKKSGEKETNDDPEAGRPIHGRPDDPGIRPEDQKEKPKRFGLF